MDQSDGQKKYGYLNQLSTTYLEGILRADIESSEGGDEDMILYILEVIEQRKKNNQTGVICDVDEAWEEFQEHYMGLESPLYPSTISSGNSEYDRGNVISISPHGLTAVKHRQPAQQRTSRTFLKRLILVAATISVLLAGMVTAQAVGMDVFGALAKWTDEVFHFISPTSRHEEPKLELVQAEINSDAKKLHDAFQVALDECGIATALAPGWFPDGCVPIKEAKTLSTGYMDKISCEYEDLSNARFVFTVQRYNQTVLPELMSTEKDGCPIEEYLANERLFYIMSNNEFLSAAWSDGKSTVVTVTGNIPIETLKRILNSIGE